MRVELGDDERRVVCEGCGELIETETIPDDERGQPSCRADRLSPVEDCILCTPDDDGGDER